MRARNLRVLLVGATIVGCTTVELSTTTQALVMSSVSSLTFGTSPVGTASSPMPVTLQPMDLGVSTDDIVRSITPNGSDCQDFVGSGSQTPPFHITETCGVATIPDAGTGNGTGVGPGLTPNCTTVTYTFNVTFTPSYARAESCDLVIDWAPASGTGSGTGSGSGVGSDIKITMTGSGSAVPSAIHVIPPSIDFNGLAVDASSTSPLTVLNVGTQGLMIGVPTLPTVGAFSVGSANTAPVMLASGSALTYNVTCTPTAVQVYSDNLVVNSNAANGSAVAVSLECTGLGSGSGSGPGGGGNPETDRQTYYACSAGNGVGVLAWPAGALLVVVGLRRRRRR